MDYFNSKYLTLVGHVQSGKTNEEINYCYSSINNGYPVIFLVRNIRADQLQLSMRISQFNETIDTPLKVKILSHGSVEQIAKSMEINSIIIVLCNRIQLKKMKEVLKIYKGEYNVCIDEVDFSIKSKNNQSESDVVLSQIKKGANHILGATATPIAVFTTQREMSKVIKLKPDKRYHGIESLNVNYVNNCVTNNPQYDTPTINKIYSSLLKKDSAFLLHSVTKKRKNHLSLLWFVSELFPTFTYIIYNGDGIQVLCKKRDPEHFAKNRSVNKYGQNILKYHLLKKNNYFIHFFENYSISEVLQLLVNDPFYNHTHISIISGHLASRGVSFVSSDYSLHLTDQYFNAGPQTHGESYLQSLRILGCYNDSKPLTLWCSERSWKRIIQHNKIINNIVDNIHNNSEWLTKIQEIIINKPDSPLTRPALTSKFRKISKEHFSLEISDEV
jgi:hypothetical protein